MNALELPGLLLLAFAFVGGIILLVVRSRRFRHDIDDLLAGGAWSEKIPAVLTDALAAANVRSSNYTFGVERAAKILFRGQPIWFVLGPVGSKRFNDYGLTWSTQQSLYALADCRDQTNWMAAHSDVFSPACPESSFPVFWVHLATLKAIGLVQRKEANGSVDVPKRTPPTAGSRP